MYASEVMGAALATETANEWPTNSGYTASVSGSIVTLTADSTGNRVDSSITNVNAGSDGNLSTTNVTLAKIQDGRTADTEIDPDQPRDTIVITKSGGERNGSRTIQPEPEVPASDMTDRIQQEPNTPNTCLLYTSPSPRDRQKSRMPSSA